MEKSLNQKTQFIEIEVNPEQAGSRLDKFLGNLPDIQTRSRAAHLIDQGIVKLNGRVTQKAAQKLKLGDIVEVELESPGNSSQIIPLHLKLDIHFEDEHILVLNKPAGLVVHPAAGHAEDTLVNALVAHTSNLSMKFGENRPGIVHRLDKDTSGLMVVAKNDFAHENLTQQFRKRSIHRVYFAVTMGGFTSRSGIIKSYLARHPSQRKKFASVRSLGGQILPELKLFANQTNLNPTSSSSKPAISAPPGKWAVTHYDVVKSHSLGFHLVRLKLETGRTHQIRVHLSENKCPIVADEIYGYHRSLSEEKKRIVDLFPRLGLHARELGFIHPHTGEKLSFSAEWPKDLLKGMESLGFV